VCAKQRSLAVPILLGLAAGRFSALDLRVNDRSRCSCVLEVSFGDLDSRLFSLHANLGYFYR
jgi:hypothetical protein